MMNNENENNGSSKRTEEELPPLLEVRQSTINDAGEGVFANRAILEGETVTWYYGTVVSPKAYFLLDTQRHASVHYTLSCTAPDQSEGEGAPAASRILVAEGWDKPEGQPSCCGHKLNDALAINFPPVGDPITQGPEERKAAYERSVRRYAEALRSSAHDASPWNVAVLPHSLQPLLPKEDEEGKEENSSRSSPPMRGKCALVSTRPIAAGEELFLSYGFGYWASRTYSELYWAPEASAETRQLARELRMIAAKVVLEEQIDTTLPSLPPRVGLVSSEVKAAEGESTGSSGYTLVDLDTDGSGQRVSSSPSPSPSSWREVPDEELLLVALSVFNRDPSVTVLPKKALRRLIIAAMRKMAETQ